MVYPCVRVLYSVLRFVDAVNGWYGGYKASDSSQKGWFPAEYCTEVSEKPKSIFDLTKKVANSASPVESSPAKEIPVRLTSRELTTRLAEAKAVGAARTSSDSGRASTPPPR